MGIEATSSSSTVSSTTSSAQVSSASNSDSAKKTSTESSFKDEMDKVSSKEDKKDSKVEETKSKDVDKTQTSETNKKDTKEDDDNLTLNGNADYSKYGSLSLNDANKMLSSDIMQMMAQAQVSETSEVRAASSIFSFGSDNANQVSLTQNDAQFFINLTKSEDVSGQNIALQAQNMIANGGDFAEVAQNAKISQTLLNALSNARETNQPLRIDFDQNVSVILRIGQDGALSARFIPGDKAVEQYLRNNIESLKATFRENDLPYSDLSYSNSSKQQNERRRNKQQQGE